MIIIQARTGSSRLPSKVLLELCNTTVLEIMFKRLESLKDQIVVATTNDGSEEPIVKICKKHSVSYFKGDENNVLKRFADCAKEFGSKYDDTIVRLTSDCPLIDVDIVSDGINFFEKNSFEYVSNVESRTFPRGMDCEIFLASSLFEAYKNAKTVFEKEHVTPYIKGNSNIGSFKDDEDNSNFRLTLDVLEDYEVIKSIYNEFNCQTNFSYKELIALLKNRPQLTLANKNVEQKTN